MMAWNPGIVTSLHPPAHGGSYCLHCKDAVERHKEPVDMAGSGRREFIRNFFWQHACAGHTHSERPSSKRVGKTHGARGRTRTDDLRITSALLCRLSYSGGGGEVYRRGERAVAGRRALRAGPVHR
jgi:hypothetical protein